MNMKRWWILKGIKMFLLFLLFGAVMSYVMMLLWNWLMPVLFGLAVINFWQAFGLLLISKLIFGFGRGGWGHSGHWKQHSHHLWKEKMEEKLKTMSPEDREKFREEWKKRCGWKYSNFENEKSQDQAANNSPAS